MKNSYKGWAPPTPVLNGLIAPLIGFIILVTPFIRSIYRGLLSLHVLLTILGARPTVYCDLDRSVSTSFRKKPWGKHERKIDFMDVFSWEMKNSSNNKGEGFLPGLVNPKILYIYYIYISRSFFRSEEWTFPKAISYSCPLYCWPILWGESIFSDLPGRELKTWNAWEPSDLLRWWLLVTVNQKFSVIPTHLERPFRSHTDLNSGKARQIWLIY